jgi:hypothetical protein
VGRRREPDRRRRERAAPPDLLAYHRPRPRPERVFHPASLARDRPARLTLDDADLMSALRADGTPDTRSSRLRIGMPSPAQPPSPRSSTGLRRRRLGSERRRPSPRRPPLGLRRCHAVPAGDETSLVTAFVRSPAAGGECIVRAASRAEEILPRAVRARGTPDLAPRRKARCSRGPYVLVRRSCATWRRTARRTGFAPAFADHLYATANPRGCRVRDDGGARVAAVVADSTGSLAGCTTSATSTPAASTGSSSGHGTLRFLAIDPERRRPGR